LNHIYDNLLSYGVYSFAIIVEMKSKARKRNPVVQNREEIYAQYPSEWLLIADPVSDKQFNLVRGRVIFHSKDRDAVYRRAVRLRPKHFATLFTGKPSNKTEFVL
jgi:hypothetical protein